MPGSDGVLGFKIYYDRNYYRAYKKLIDAAGLEVREQRVIFWSSSYFAFFAPIYVLSLGLDLVRRATIVKSLASYYVFVLERPASEGSQSSAHDSGRELVAVVHQDVAGSS